MRKTDPLKDSTKNNAVKKKDTDPTDPPGPVLLHTTFTSSPSSQKSRSGKRKKDEKR